MKTVILAGGFGTRLRPLTVNIPKPMAPIMNMPILEHTIELLKKHNLKEITMMLFFQPDVITNYFKDGSKFGVKINYITSDKDLGTAGCMTLAKQHLKNEQFLVISGDVLTNFNLTEGIEFHNKRRASGTIFLTRVKDPLRYGIVILEPDGKIRRLLEKPSWGEVFSDTINTGIYIFEPSVFDLIPDDTDFDFSKNLFPKMLQAKERLYGYIAEGYWRDIGTLAEYRQTHEDILNGEIDCIIKGERKGNIGSDLYIGSNVKISATARLKGSVLIGSNSVVDDNVELSNVVIGDNCHIDKGAKLVRTIMWNNNSIGKEADIKEAAIGSGNKIMDKVYIGVGAVISDDCVIGKEAIIKPEVKLWPNKKIEEGSILSTSLVWAERWNNRIFDAYGITAIANQELTPEIATKIGAAYASTLPVGSYVLISRDYHRSSFMIERSMMAGILSAGINIYDFRVMPLAVSKYVAKSSKVPGFHIRKSPYEEKMLDIKFFDKEGLDLSFGMEKSIESSYFREEYRKVTEDKIGRIVFPPRALEYYKEGFMRAIDAEKIKEKKFKIIIDYSYSSALNIFPSILGELNCEVIALNAHTDEKRLTRSAEQMAEAQDKMAEMVKILKANAGIIIDSSAQKIQIVDDKGRELKYDTGLLAMISLFLHRHKGATVAVPVTASEKVEPLVKKLGGKIIRVGTTYRAMLIVADNKTADFVGEEKGGFVFSAFEPAFDSMFSTVKLLEYLAYYGKPLSKAVDEIPETYKLVEYITGPWDKRGAVMKQLFASKGASQHNIEGILFKEKNGRVLVLPHNDKPVFELYAEGKTKKASSALMKKYHAMLKRIIDKA